VFSRQVPAIVLVRATSAVGAFVCEAAGASCDGVAGNGPGAACAADLVGIRQTPASSAANAKKRNLFNSQNLTRCPCYNFPGLPEMVPAVEKFRSKEFNPVIDAVVLAIPSYHPQSTRHTPPAHVR
jgi:hypothetical protein